MTTTHAHPAGLGHGWQSYAVIGVVVSLALTAFGTFTNLAGATEEGDHTFTEWLVVAGMTLIGAAIVFGVVARAVTASNAGAVAVVLGAIGALSTLVFWTGLPAVIAAAALACVARERDENGRISVAGKVGAGLAVLTVAAAVVFAVVG